MLGSREASRLESFEAWKQEGHEAERLGSRIERALCLMSGPAILEQRYA